jgi:CRP-like cAMP-binding protein
MVRLQTPPSAILKSKLLSEIDAQATEEILRVAKLRKFLPRHTIVTGGEPAVELFLLQMGRARYYRLTRSGREILIGWLLPGDAFGLGSLLNEPLTYMGTAEAMRPCEALCWNHEQIKELARKYPQIAENGLRIVLHHLKSYLDRHIGLITKNSQERLAATLIHLANKAGRSHASGVEIDATNEQLSGLADISQFTASRLLSGWERLGAISKKRGRVIVHTPETFISD